MTAPNPHFDRIRTLIDQYMMIHGSKRTVRILDSALRKNNLGQTLMAFYLNQKHFVRLDTTPGKASITVTWK